MKSEISEEDIEMILNGTLTLTALSERLQEENPGVRGYTRNSVKSKILKMLENNPERNAKFLKQLEKNSAETNLSQKRRYPFDEDEYMMLDLIKKQSMKSAYARLSTRGEKYSINALTKKYLALQDYFFANRNKGMSPVDKIYYSIKESDVLRMIDTTPKVLTISISEKITPCLELLDSRIDKRYTNYIIREYPNIMCSSLERTTEQLDLLRDFGLLDRFIAKPKDFIYPPESMYALIRYALEGKKEGVSDIEHLESVKNIFIPNAKLEREGQSLENLRKKYPYEEYLKSKNALKEKSSGGVEFND